MRTFVLAASFAAVIALAGCQSGPVQPVPSPSGDAGVPTATPMAPASPEPSVTPRPSQPAPTAQPPAATAKPAPVATPRPKPVKPTFNVDEKYLRAGILRGAKDCVPVRDGLPSRSRAGIECASDHRAVSRIGFYLYDKDEDMVAAYIARMAREGVELESGPDCRVGEGEGAYVPWEPGEIGPMRASSTTRATPTTGSPPATAYTSASSVEPTTWARWRTSPSSAATTFRPSRPSGALSNRSADHQPAVTPHEAARSSIGRFVFSRWPASVG